MEPGTGIRGCDWVVRKSWSTDGRVFGGCPIKAAACFDSTESDGGEQGLDHDHLGQLFAQRQARVADLTNEVVAAGDETNDLIFTQANLAQTRLNLWRSAELFDSNSDASLDAAQRARFTTNFLACCRIQVFAHAEYNARKVSGNTNPGLRFPVPELQPKVRTQSKHGRDCRAAHQPGRRRNPLP